MVDANRHLRSSGEKLDIIPQNQPSNDEIEGEFFDQKRSKANAEDDDNQTNYTEEKIEIKDDEETCKLMYILNLLL